MEFVLAFAAIVIDRNCRIVTMTSAAEYILKTKEFVTVRQNRIERHLPCGYFEDQQCVQKLYVSGYETGYSQTIAITGTRGSIANIRFSPSSCAQATELR